MGRCICINLPYQLYIFLMIVYGVISYILIIAMIVGYFLVKKWGDRQEKVDYDTFQEEKVQQSPQPS